MSQEINHWLRSKTKKPIDWLSLVRLASWCAAGFFVYSSLGVTAAQAAGPTYVGRTITANIAWGQSGSPYVLQYPTAVNAGVTLTIEPGVVVKATPSGMLIINGAIQVTGTAEAPVIFTSYKDDTVGGDTNNDGSVTKPTAGDWPWLKFASGSSGSVSYAEFRYGGYYWQQGQQDGQLIVEGSSPTISHLSITRGFRGGFGYGIRLINSSSIISDSFIANDYPAVTGNSYGVVVYGGAPKILNSEITSNFQAGIVFAQGYTLGSEALVSGNRIYNNSQPSSSVRYGLLNASTSLVDARNNWWGHDSGPKISSNPGGLGQDIYGPLLYDPWIGKVTNQPPVLSWLGADGYQNDGVDPSISFTGSVPTFKVVYTDPDNDAPAALKLFIDSTSYDLVAEPGDGDFRNGEIYSLVPPLGVLIKGLHNYHFEASDGTVSVRLPAKGELPFEVRWDPVIIIPGILGSAEKNGQWVIDPILHTYDDLIDTLKANGYTEGQDLFTLPYNWHLSNVITAILLKHKIDDVKNVCGCSKVDLVTHSMGGLVARQYVQSGQYTGDVDQLIFLGTPHLGSPKAYLAWEAGEFGVNTEDRFQKFVFTREGQKQGFTNLFDYIKNEPIVSIQQLLPIFSYLRDKGTATLRVYPTDYPQNTFLEQLLNTSSSLSVVRSTNIIGSLGNNSTINYIRVINSSNLPLWENGYPDGYDGSTADRGLEKGDGDGTVPLSSASFITNDLNIIPSNHRLLPSNAEGLTFKKLTNQDATQLISKWRVPDFKILLIKILSPVDIVVIAPDGKRIGKDFSVNQEINEIDGAFYSGFLTDDEYVTIPNPLDGEYHIQTQGTDNGGSYTVAVGYISDEQSVERDFTAQTTPGLVTELKLNIDNANPSAIEVKPTDATPPQITIISPITKDYLRSETLPVNFAVADAESGVFTQEVKLDGKVVQNGDQIDLFYEKLGDHKLVVSATDFVGNTAKIEVPFRVVATPESTVSDVERAYVLGWIKNRGIKESLIRKLKLIVKLEKRVEFIEEKLPGKQKVIKKVEKLERKIDKVLLGLLRYELKALRRGHINEQAYTLLSEDINWLLDN